MGVSIRRPGECAQCCWWQRCSARAPRATGAPWPRCRSQLRLVVPLRASRRQVRPRTAPAQRFTSWSINSCRRSTQVINQACSVCGRIRGTALTGTAPMRQDIVSLRTPQRRVLREQPDRDLIGDLLRRVGADGVSGSTRCEDLDTRTCHRLPALSSSPCTESSNSVQDFSNLSTPSSSSTLTTSE